MNSKPLCLRRLLALIAIAMLFQATASNAAKAPAPADEPASVIGHPWITSQPNREPNAYFTNISDGDTRESPFVLRFGLAMRGLVPAGQTAGRAGHHHLLINQPLPLDFTKALPFTDQYIHFGKGQMEAVLNLKPGTYRMSLVLADKAHIPYFVYSKPLRVTVSKQNPQATAASVQGPPRVEILSLSDNETVRAPVRIQFHASGHNVSHAEPKVEGTGHFRMTLERPGKAAEVLAFVHGQTEVWLNPPIGSYKVRLELVSNTDSGVTMATSTPIRLNVVSHSSP